MVSAGILFMRSFPRSMLQFDLLVIFPVKCKDSVCFSFLFPRFFFFVKDQKIQKIVNASVIHN